MLELFSTIWPYVWTGTHVTIAIAASGHVVLTKREVRSAIGWVGIIWLAPLVGSLLYVLFGVNRIQRRAQKLRADRPEMRISPGDAAGPATRVRAHLGDDAAHLEQLVQVVDEVTGRPLLSGNKVEPLIDGEVCYPAMLAAIAGAQRSIAFSTFIFDNDRAGEMFLEALRDALQRGVEVRVLIDSVGSRYTFPSIVGKLRRAGLNVARFLPTLVPGSFRYANMRSHRKILVVDGRLGFTGGMNVREGCLLKLEPPARHLVQDLHFQIAGPVVADLQRVFVEDWHFSTGELLQGELWFPPIETAGPILARGVPDGPDEDLDKLPLTILGALSCAQRTVRIVTPYFLPDLLITTALNVAAMRGVEVDIVLPRENNQKLVAWAMNATLPQVLERGCRVWFTPPPFDHTKLMLVDGLWTLLGSANWDARSLRLNFEFNVECYDRGLTARMEQLVQQKIATAQRVTIADLEGRLFPLRLRDNIVRLMTPYL
jgi:cardiolipin synthase